MKKPIVFIIFNRPDTTKIVFDKIRMYQPKRLFVIADGPRLNKTGEKELCQEARNIVQVDWDCEVEFIYSDENLGCQKRITSGLDTVFMKVEQAIILEDDCVPHPDFFPYCEEMLEIYKDNERIMAISGNNFQSGEFELESSYYFSVFPHCWGWATWRRAWDKMDVEMTEWPTIKENNDFNKYFYDLYVNKYWTEIFDNTYEGNIDSWAYPWTFSCWNNNGLTILPAKNLVNNIGFSINATHTKFKDSKLLNRIAQALKFPLEHPKKIEVNKKADNFTSNHVYNVRLLKEKIITNERKMLFTKILINESEKIFSSYSNIVIFGTNELGRIINQYAKKKAINVKCFLETENSSDKFLVDGIPVKSITDIKFLEEVLDFIIVSVEGNHDKKIIAMLKSEFKNTVVVSWKDYVEQID